MELKFAVGAITTIIASLLFLTYAPATTIISPEEDEAPLTSELTKDNPDIQKRLGAVNEIGVIINRIETIKTTHENLNEGKVNRGLEAVNYLAKTVNDSLEQKQANGKTGFEILQSPPPHLANDFSAAFNGNDKESEKLLAQEFDANLEKALNNANISISDQPSNDYDSINR